MVLERRGRGKYRARGDGRALSWEGYLSLQVGRKEVKTAMSGDRMCSSYLITIVFVLCEVRGKINDGMRVQRFNLEYREI